MSEQEPEQEPKQEGGVQFFCLMPLDMHTNMCCRETELERLVNKQHL